MIDNPRCVSMIRIPRSPSPVRLISLLVVALALGPPAPSAAQDFTPPEEEGREVSGVRIGVFGFSTRFGYDLSDNQPIIGAALDLGNLGSDRVRFRPSIEVGFGEGSYTYTTNAEIVYRFTSDTETAIPYVGFGLGIFVEDSCGSLDGCPSVWAQFALGFEVRLRDNFDWFIEYHGEDALSRQRFFVGLTSRRF